MSPASNAPTPKPPHLGADNQARAKYKKPERYIDNPDAIVIGSGIGGLSISSLLAQKKGMRVLLLEGNSVPGGCTHVHEYDGFEFPSGIDSIGDMDASIGRGLNRPTIDFLTGGHLDWAKMPDDHEVAHYPGAEYRWYSSPKKNIEMLASHFPDEVDAIRAYYKLEEKVEAAAWAWGATKLMPKWLPGGVHRGFYSTFGGAWRKYMLRNTHTVLTQELGMSEKLARVFEYMYGNHGATPKASPFSFHAVNLFHYRYGAYYPVGGPGYIAECIVPIIERAGGQLAVSSRVAQILVEGNKAVGVELEDGTVLRSKLIISDASAHTTYTQLLPKDVADRHGLIEAFTTLKPSPAHSFTFLGYDEWVDLPEQIYWEVPGWDIDTTDARYKAEEDLDAMGVYVLAPSVRDPSHRLRYPGKSTIVAIAEVPAEWVERGRTDAAWAEQFSQRVGDKMVEKVHEVMPELRGKVPAFRKTGLPMGCNPWAWGGCSLGLEPSGARFTEHTHWLTPQSPVQNLWLTGQDIFSAGFSGAMLGGRMTYTALSGNWLNMLLPGYL